MSYGLLVDPTNAGEFADAIITLLENRSLSEEMGRAGRKTIEKHFSWEAIARKHIEFYGKFIPART